MMENRSRNHTVVCKTDVELISVRKQVGHINFYLAASPLIAIPCVTSHGVKGAVQQCKPLFL